MASPQTSPSKRSAEERVMDRTKYWSDASTSSPAHVLQTPYHALIALLGCGGFACFSFGLVEQRPFDASLAGVVVLLCLYIYTLQSERCQRKAQWKRDFGELSMDCASTGLKPGRKASTKANARGSVADGTSELDLTGYAKTLGVSLRDGVVHKEGSTLNKILMDALAKEYLRCMSALKAYQSAFGPLPDDSAEQGAAGTTASSVPADALQTTLEELRAMDLAALGESGGVDSAAPTPRSPTGPPSPDPKRGRKSNVSGCSNETGLSAALDAALAATPPAPSAPANTPATKGLGRDGSSSPSLGGMFSKEPASFSAQLEAITAPLWDLDEMKKGPMLDSPAQTRLQEPEPNTNFGLFGARVKQAL